MLEGWNDGTSEGRGKWSVEHQRSRESVGTVQICFKVEAAPT